MLPSPFLKHLRSPVCPFDVIHIRGIFLKPEKHAEGDLRSLTAFKRDAYSKRGVTRSFIWKGTLMVSLWILHSESFASTLRPWKHLSISVLVCSGHRLHFEGEWNKWATSIVQLGRKTKPIEKSTSLHILGTIRRLLRFSGSKGLRCAMMETKIYKFAQSLLDQGRSAKYVADQVFYVLYEDLSSFLSRFWTFNRLQGGTFGGNSKPCRKWPALWLPWRLE